MVGRREPVDRVVDVLVAAPICTWRAAVQVGPLLADAIRRGITVGPPADHLPAEPVEAPGAAPEPGDDGVASSHPAPAVRALAIDDYDHLAARQVVDRLGGLDADELTAVDAYERANRHRQTILRRIEQLQS